MTPQSKRPLKAASQQNVPQFLDNLDHPQKKEIEEVRGIVLSVSDQITERIKWNAPSFCINNDDRFTFNLHGEGFFRLIFHCGAKVRNTNAQGRLIDDHSGLLEWVANDRAVVKFTSGNDVADKKKKLIEVIRKWIEAATFQ